MKKSKVKASNDRRLFRLSAVAFITYTCIAIILILLNDREHSLMFLCGAILWGIAAFIWGDNAEHSDEM